VNDYWRPVDLARAVGVSAQTVRIYEQVGFLPPAARSATRYRRYEARHMRALQAARLMITGYGWESALHIMRYAHAGEVDAAVALVDACHAALHQSRHETRATLTALHGATTSLLDDNSGQPCLGRPLRIGAVARRVGVRVSTVRSWEKHGLVRPRRDSTSGYRLYDAAEVGRVQVIALLRNGGYGFDAIRPVLTELATGHPEQVAQAAERRLADVAEESRRCSAATAAFWTYIEDL